MGVPSVLSCNTLYIVIARSPSEKVDEAIRRGATPHPGCHVPISSGLAMTFVADFADITLGMEAVDSRGSRYYTPRYLLSGSIG